ncbi:MAG: ABC transporter ATP-binding protein/permease [Clostridiales bacterium]|nr:ABC transporter ATP-binding protein/permease [Clostridiales bacterium]
MAKQSEIIANHKGKRRPDNPFKTIARLLSYYKNCMWALIIAVVCILLYSAATIAAGYMLDPLVKVLESALSDKAGIHMDEQIAKYTVLLIYMAVLYFAGVITNFGLNRLMLQCTATVMAKLRTDLFDRMQELPVGFFDSHTHGELMSYYTNDVDAIREMLNNSVTQLLISTASLTGVVIAMISLSAPLFLIVLVLGTLVVLITKFIASRSGKNFVHQQKALAKVNGYIEEMMEGQRVVKAFNHEEKVMTDFDEMNEELRHVATRASTLASIMGPIMNNLSHIFYALTTTIGVLFAANGELIASLSKNSSFDWTKIGVEGSVLITFLSFIRQFSNRVSEISQQFNYILLALAGAERVFKLMDMPPEIDDGAVTLETGEDGSKVWRVISKEGEITKIPLVGKIELHDVDFSYDGNKLVLEDVTLYAKKGQKIAFVGSTGAGKTTITNLINRFYDVNDGEITYDGIDIRNIKKDDLRGTLGMVLQDTHLFTGTVMENIRYGKLDATDEDCIAAAKIANADYFISHLPEGYRTMLYSDGANLSQGQRQLIAIARAAVASPTVLILDEATSSIDTRTEKLIESGMDKLMEGRTVFVIAHRLSTVRNSNAIMVLEHGRIIERGDHEDLLRQQGEYYKLYTGAFELS